MASIEKFLSVFLKPNKALIHTFQFFICHLMTKQAEKSFRPLEMYDIITQDLICPKQLKAISHLAFLHLKGVAKRRHEMVDGSLRRFLDNKIDFHV
jgi:hypothetical protein